MKSLYTSRFLLALVLLLESALGGGAFVFGQAISGDLVGTIQDASGAGIPGASVSVVNDATNVRTTATANDAGEYRISNLPAGAYTLSATGTGFGTSTLKGVKVSLNTTSTANLALQVSATSTTIEVSTAAAQIDTTTAQIQSTYTTRQVQDLPVNSIGLGVLNLSLLQAGVATTGGMGMGDGPSVGGQRPRNNNFTIEGVDNNSKSVTGAQVFVPNDAVQEFTVLLNQFQAEYGHSSGGQFNVVVRTGTNQLHGMLYDYLRNRNLNALDQAFQNQGLTSNPRYDQNRLGGQFGGPIRKDKWFYFANFEYNPLGQASTTGNVAYAPTSAGYSILAGLPGINQNNLNVMKQYALAPAVTTGADVPSLTVGGASIPLGALNSVGPNYTNDYFGVLSSDYNISEKDQIRGRYVYNRGLAISTDNVTLPFFYTPVPTTNYLATLAWYHTFSPSLTNELRLGYNRQNQSFPVGSYDFPGLDQFPNLQFNDIQLQIGPNPNYPQYNISNMYQGVDNASWIHGSHSFKFGTELRRYISPTSFTQRSRGDYEYADVASYLTDQTPDFIAQRGLGNVVYYGDQIASFSYIQDAWRARPNLTINLGARYEYTTIPQSERLQSVNAIANVPGLITFGTPKTQKNAITPRVGLAYTPGSSQNTVIRAGFGMAYDVLFDNIGTLSLPPQFSTSLDVTGAPTPPGGFLASGGILPNAATGNLTVDEARSLTSTYIIDQVLPYSISYNFEIEHIFAKDYTFTVRYLGTQGVHLPTQLQINKVPKISSDSYLPTYLTMPSAATLAALPLTLGDIQARSNVAPAYLAAGFTNLITAYTAQGHSTYNGLALQLNRRFSNGLQFLAAYTWSHNIDNATAEFNTTSLTPRRAQNFLDLTSERATSALDRRHRFSLSVLYDVPFFQHSSNWFMKNLIGNWEIAPIYTYESPEYFTVQSGIDSNQNGDSAPDRTIINPNGAPHTGSGVFGVDRTGAKTSGAGVVAYVATNPNAKYIQAGLGALATSGRNTEPTRPINNVDMTLIKRFSAKERFHFELQGQAFNLFNHPQFIPGSINDVGRVTTIGLNAYVNANSVNFNNPEAFFTSNARLIQVVGKFIW
ncbi:MAG TPA: carboxypeptidase regulatory-like domain-containing protein [Bryobacteraceae bacterium]